MVTDPKWLRVARTKLGTKEAAGSANSATILGWAKRPTRVLGMVYNADSVPWCGVFVAHCLQEDGIEPVSIAVRATSWSTWGLSLRPERLAPGAVLVFERPGGGHVGFYIGEDATAYHVLGGNQGDAVTIARIAKDRCIARRWPAGRPVIGRPVQMAARKPISTDEA
ncbi:TIGR02594 family protein [Sphingomonas sp. CFBP 8765]|jgi:uncharacterized protein (TIGR02594 family)|uniref:TIGR02594 family protein n=1 Tax=unclassified Sphingomonas TaxID=196159 RepID=UPI00177EFBBD|nr:TIGR02594 family protein [Sphingomonas sp. CFBP 8765]MBD8471481.1 TIGR02594 family protein [Sphingomonas sp. CFBP 8765]